MGRGAQAETRALTDKQLAEQNAVNRRMLAEREQARSYLMPRFEEFYSKPGFSSAEKSAITGESMGALGSAYGSEQDALERRAARTRNTAGVPEATAEMARAKGRDAASIARQNEIDFANRALQDKTRALQGISSLYGIDADLLARQLGIPAQLLKARADASQGGGFWGSLVGAGGGVGAAAITAF